uniref:Porin domain-containing protein n=1 Tax=Magnetococcus massalia (strain MO-1) TaxID=451514 RepID=A0A1S7LH79_MAGMO|nr:Conserved exported protein of unknown function [Candidatus Magnetococcus massalia]
MIRIFSKTAIHAAVIASFCGTAAVAQADSMPSKEEMWSIIQQQQKQISQLQKMVTSTDAKVESVAKTGSTGTKWSDKITISGTVEVDATTGENFAGVDNADLDVATAELSIDAQVAKQVSANVTLLYEESAGAVATQLDVDGATITIKDESVTPFYLTAGLMTLPFGVYETGTMSDPLTLELTETGDTAVLVGVDYMGFHADVYGFNGSSTKTGDEEKINKFGANLAYTLSQDAFTLNIGAGYLSGIEDSDGISGALGADNANMTDHVDAWNLHANVAMGPVTLSAEYVGLSDPVLNSTNAVLANLTNREPSAWSIGGDYALNLGGMDAGLHVAYSATDDAQHIGLAENRFAISGDLAIFENTTLAAEYATDEDYSTADGGTGADNHTATLRLGVSF